MRKRIYGDRSDHVEIALNLGKLGQVELSLDEEEGKRRKKEATTKKVETGSPVQPVPSLSLGEAASCFELQRSMLERLLDRESGGLPSPLAPPSKNSPMHAANGKSSPMVVPPQQQQQQQQQHETEQEQRPRSSKKLIRYLVEAVQWQRRVAKRRGDGAGAGGYSTVRRRHGWTTT